MENKSFIRLPPVVSDGRMGFQFIKDSERIGLEIGPYAKKIFLRKEYNKFVTKNVVYYPGIIKGEEFSDNLRKMRYIRKEGIRRGGMIPPLELVTLLRSNFFDEQIKSLGILGLTIMHEPVWGHNGGLSLFVINANGVDYPVNICSSHKQHIQHKDMGYVFLIPQWFVA